MVETNKLETVEKGNKTRIIALLLLGLVGVIVSTRLVVLSRVNIALILDASPILIGAKVVTIGTSLPELTLDRTTVRRGRGHLTIGDIIGSNLTNHSLVLGLVLLTSPFTVDITIFTENFPFLLITNNIFPQI